jgi:hypothetical protein
LGNGLVFDVLVENEVCILLVIMSNGCNQEIVGIILEMEGDRGNTHFNLEMVPILVYPKHFR